MTPSWLAFNVPAKSALPVLVGYCVGKEPESSGYNFTFPLSLVGGLVIDTLAHAW